MSSLILQIGTLTTLLTLALLLKIGFEIRHNLIYYSIYYAQNLNHSNKADPVMATLIDNLYDIPKPENDQIGYDFDGINIIYLKNKYTRLSGFKPNYTLFHNRNIYKFNTQGIFYNYTVMGDEISYNFKEKEQEAKELTYTILQPIIEIQPKPPKYANLQWLFNITYGRRFQ